MTTIPQRWRKSTFSTNTADCIELGSAGAVRDSKNPMGSALQVDLASFVEAVKTGRLDG